MDQPATDQPQPAMPPPKHFHFMKIFRNGGEYLFQFFMLFLAVTAGFFADNLREDFGERRQTSEYARSMASDIARDTSNLDYQLRLLKNAINEIDALAAYVRGKKIEELSNIELCRYAGIRANPPFRWSRATMEQIKNSGSLRYFTNDSIALGISQYDALNQHLDRDNLDDQQFFQNATEAMTRVVDLNYPNDVMSALATKRELPGDAIKSHSLITRDLHDVNMMVNAYLIARQRAVNRNSELLEVLVDQRRLIKMLKRDYGLK